MPYIPEAILDHLLPFLMVLFRITGIFIYAPLFGSRIVPMKLKVLLALALSFAVYSAVSGSLTWSDQWGIQNMTVAAVPTIALMVFMELMIGVVIGFGASLPLIAMQVGGMIMGQQMGLGIAQVLNPEFNENSEIIGQVLFWGAMAIFIAIDGHQSLLLALMNSFHKIPLTGFAPGGDVFELILGLIGAMMELALRVSAPLLCIVFLESIALGFIAKTVPQLNILSLGFPLRIILGIMTLVFLAGPILTVTGDDMRETLTALLTFFSIDNWANAP